MTRSIGTGISHWVFTAIALLILGCAPSAFADGATASMTLTSAGSNPFDGIYMGPYTASINGASTPVICDDFSDDSFINESWTANTTGLSDLTGTKFVSQVNSTQGYGEVAALTLALLNPANASQADQIQYAIWAVFGGPAVQTYLQGTLSAANYTNFYTNGVLNWLSWGAGQTLTADQLAAFTIYTPNTDYAITCSGHACQNTPPQEFIALTPTPESGTAALFGIGLLALGFFMRRRNALATK
ncbi:MAG TPA: PEP-CTERM sorting domain-containing protein [Candidatus Acidoferrales bacterium]|nr:PEP-CTERM sorting domain-containing protein [Candidatus Acidoferrales bacterium]